MSKPIKKLVDDYKSSPPKEIWVDGVFYNFRKFVFGITPFTINCIYGGVFVP